MPQSFLPSNIRELLDAALMANAAYVSMSPGQYATETSLRLTLQNSGRFTDPEVDYLISRYRVVRAVSPFTDLLATISGFNASLWQRLDDNGNGTDQYTIAFEGTEEVPDFFADLQIGASGAAKIQAKALQDWVTRLYTGTSAGGFGLLDRFDEVDLTGHSLGGHLVQWAVGAFQEGPLDGNIWLPANPFTDGYTFNGAGIDNPISDILNIATLPKSLRNLQNPLSVLSVLGALETTYRVLSGNYLWNDGNFGIENIISSAGLDVIPSFLTGMRPGEDTRIFTEDQSDRSLIGNHTIAPLVDSLFLYNVFEGFAGIDEFGRTQLDLGTMQNILQATSANPFDTLERVLNYVQRLLPGTSVSELPSANIDTAADGSDGTYEALAIAIAQELEDNPQSPEILDLFRQGPSFVGDRALVDDARGLAYRVALVEGLPLVLFGLDYQQGFNQDGRYDRDNFTERFLRDRAAFAAALFKANAEDIPSGGTVSVFQENRYFENNLGTPANFFAVDADTPPPVNTLAQMFFGDDSDNSYTGGDESDSLYGMGGNDTLVGGAGNDYIEGGDGDDDLTGGDGSNTLLGGDGNDLYRISVGETVEITDTDGQGSIIVERPDGSFFQLGSQSISAVADQANVYRDNEGFTYVLDGSTLSISGPDGEKITIRDFAPGIIPLGINLAGFQAFNPPGTAVEFNVDVFNQPPGADGSNQYIEQFGRYNNQLRTWDSAGVWFWFQDYEAYLISGDEDFFRTEIINATSVPDSVAGDPLNGSVNRFYVISGGFGDSYITGDDGFNWLNDDSALWPETPYLGTYGMGPIMGDDVILGLGGEDWIRVSGGDDFVEGGAGNDVIVSSHANYDISIAINGDPPFTFTPYGDVSWVSQPGNSSDDRLFGGIGNDYIIAHGGNQIMDGGADDDELFGGAGNDVLIGGTGNDVLAGDTRQAGPLTEAIPNPNPAGPPTYVFVGDNLTFDASDPAQWGNDTLDGGEGNDVLYGGAGDDSLSGGPGDDRLQGDFVFAYDDLRPGLQNRPADPLAIHGDDILLGGAGNDELLGYGGDDLIEGGPDDDFAAGGEGSDIVRGDGGIDELQGNEGDDFLYGGDGDDTLFGQEDNDELYGEDGNDQLVGGDGDDFLSGGLMDDALFGEAGEDILEGGSGVDDLQGGAGNDTLIGGSGNDLLIGGSGDDTYVITGADGLDQITDTEGSNRLVFDILPTDLSVSIENGLVYIDYAPGNYLFMTPETFSTFDTIEIGSAITLDSGYINDLYQPGGSSGSNFTLTPGASTSDLVIFGRNNDLVIVYTGPEADWFDSSTLNGRDVLFEEGDALDFGYSSSAPAISLTNWYIANAPYLNFVNDNNGGFIDLIDNPSISRFFEAKAGGSLWAGSVGDDTFTGGLGQDAFNGGDGNDQITGGGFTDTLIGGAGDDTYFYNLGDDTDLISDESGFDTLQFGPGITPADLTITVNSGFLSVQIGPTDQYDQVNIVDWLDQADSPIDRFVFDDGTILTVDDINALISGNRQPALSTPLDDVAIDYETAFSFTVPANAFTDPNGDELTYVAGAPDGSAFPDWLSFDPATRTFSGTTPPQAGAQIFDVVVTALDTSGLEANDTFSFTVGLNLILGTDGSDSITGDESNNTIFGFAGNDTLRGGDGNDFLRADEGRDFLFGDAGDDVLLGNEGFNDLDGGAGNDELISGPGGARMYGRDGNDRLIGGAARDTMDGGAGQNTYEIGPGGGIDTIEYQSAGTHTIQLGTGIQATDISASFEGLGGSFDLTIFYNPSDPADNITLGDVFLRFGNGTGEAAPPISIDPTNYVFEFEDGSTLNVVELGDLAVISTAGDDFLFPNSQNEAVFGGDGDDTILGRYSAFVAADRDNELYGEGGNDTLSGGTGNDIMSGGDGDDSLVGGEGDDTMTGGAGIDFLRGNEGNDNLSGGDGADTLIGSEGDDIIDGGAGDDNIFGDSSFFSGSDQLFGGDGNDTIDGGSFADLIEGGAGDDTISGGGSSVDAQDQLRGGLGNDQFNDASAVGGERYLYNLGDGQDVISDTGNAEGTLAGGIPFLVEDTLEFVDGSGIQLSDLQVTRVDDNLVLTISATDSITIQNWFLSADNQIEEFITYDDLGNQIVNTAADIEALLDTENSAPVVANPLADANATEGETANIVVPADTFSDPDAGDVLTYTASLVGGAALPAWLAFDAATRTFAGTPPNNSNGSLDIEVTATDAGGLSVSDAFTLAIADANFAPTLDNPILNASVAETAALIFTVPADAFSDSDVGDTLTYSAQLGNGDPLPVWLAFDATTRTFTGTPPNNSNGSLDVEVIATDSGGLSVSGTFTLTVTDTNFAPTLDNALADADGTEGQALNLVLPANTFSDPDVGDTLTYTAQLSGGGPLPAWLAFDAATRTFTGTPPNNSNGSLDIDVIATDAGGLTASDTFTLTIADTNFAPSLDAAIADANATEGQALNFVLPAGTFSDPDDGDTLTYTAQLSGGGALPAWLDFDAATQTFTGTPPNNSNGSLDIEVIATDAGGLTASDTFTLTIADTNFAPTLDTAIADANATEGQALNFVLPAGTFSDPDDGDTLTYTAQLSGGGALPAWLDFDAATQTFTGTPPNNSNGSLDIEVIATDSGGLTASDAFTLTIADANFAPTLDNALADANATEGDALRLILPADAFSDPDAGDTLTYSAQLGNSDPLPAWLAFDAATRTFTGTPPNNSNGSLDIEVVVTDAGGLTASDTFTLTIADANFAPTLDNPLSDAAAVEEQAFSFSLPSDAFSDPDIGDTLSYTARLEGGDPLPAWLDFDAATRTFSGTPPNSSAGDIGIEIVVTDGGGLSANDVFTLTVNASNTAPSLDNPIADASGLEGQALSLALPAGTFSDPDAGDILAYSASLVGGLPLPAWLDFDATTLTFTGTPPNNSNGSLDIEVVATDSGGLTASDNFTLTIADANFAPTLDTAIADANASEGQALNFVLPAGTFSDPDDGDTLTYTAQISGGGPLPAWLDFDAATQTFTGTPPNNSNGSLDIEVIATDAGGLTASDTFTLTIADTNFAPSLDAAIADANATEGQALNFVLPAGTFSDPDAGDALAYTAQISGGGALPAWLGFDATTQTFTGTPPNNSNGSLDIEVVATDSGGLTASDNFTLTIADANFAPTLDNALADANATEGEALSLVLPADTFSDPDDGDTLTYSAQLSGGGALPTWLDFDAATQTFTGTPPNNSNGSLDIEVIATDSGGLAISDTFTLTIADANFAPTLDNAIADANASEGQPLSVAVPADTFSDADDGDTLTYTAQLSGGGALPTWLDFDAATQTFTGTPPNNSNGSLDIEVIATDSGGLAVSDTFTLAIADTNFAPTLDTPLLDAGVVEEQVFSFSLPPNAFSDPDTGDTLSYAARLEGGDPLPAWLDFDAATLTFSGTPPNSSAGDISIEIVVTDSGGLSASDIFTLTVNASNTAPSLVIPITDAGGTEGQALSIAVPAGTFSDPDAGDVLTYTAQLSGGGTLPAWLDFDAATQTFTGTPPNNSNGSLDVEVIATDTGGLSASDTFTLTIADANFAPQVDNPIADTSVAELAALVYIVPADAFSESDVGDTLTYTAQLSGGGTLPAWLDFDAATQTFTGTPPNNSNGSLDIEVIATDAGGLSASDTFTLTIANTNVAPTLDNAIADANATEGQALGIAVPAGTFSDPDDGDPLTYTAQLSGGAALPAWLDFDVATQTFTGTPPNNSNGSLDIEVIATDSGGLAISDTFTLTIADANFAPTLDNAIADANATEGQALGIAVPAGTFSDPDAGDVLTYTAQLSGGGTLPAWLDFDAAAQTFTGTPPNNSNGSLDIEVIATDAGGLTASDTFTLTIADTNFAPTLDAAIADANATEGQALTLALPAGTFSDPDTGDVLTYTAQLSGGGALPAWLDFDAATQTFTGTPPNNSNGSLDIEVIATDAGGLSASDTFTLTIADTNFAPTLDNAIPDANASEDQAFSLTVPGDTFSDSDNGDTLTLSARLVGGGALPAWLAFDAVAGTFNGTPPAGSAGSVDVEVIATDSGGLTASDSFLITISDVSNVISGTDGDDVLLGTSLADEIFGLGGNDTLRGEGADDILDGGPGADLLFGGAGADLLAGRGGPDELYGGLDNDTLIGGGGGDELFGEEGDDRLSGGPGNDILDGGVGDDELRGGDDNDVILGGDGIDTLFGGAGDDALSGGAGADVLSGDEGNDTLRGQGDADAIRGGLGDDTILGGGGADRIRGDEGNDAISGGAGNDLILGDSGDDLIRGDDGDDELFGNGGADRIFGGAGNDIIDGGAGSDTIRGNGGFDTIQGGAGNDQIQGGGGRDVIAGGDGNDVIAGGAGRDTLSGGEGSDTYIFQVGDGSDTINNSSTDSATDTLRIGAGVTSDELVFTRSGSDLLIDVGTSGDTLRIEGWFDSVVQEIDFVETIEDGRVLTAAEINAVVLGSAPASTLITTLADTMQGVDDVALMSRNLRIEYAQPLGSFTQLADTLTYDSASGFVDRRSELVAGRLSEQSGLRPDFLAARPDRLETAVLNGRLTSTVLPTDDDRHAPELSSPLTIDGSDRAHVLLSMGAAPTATDLGSQGHAGSASDPDGLRSSTTPAEAGGGSGIPPVPTAWRPAVMETEFELFRSAIEEFDTGAVGRVATLHESTEPLSQIGRIEISTVAARTPFPDDGAGITADDIDRSVSLFVASIAGFLDERDYLGERTSTHEDHDTTPQIVLPPS